MNIHEYQAKALFEKFGVPVPKGAAAKSAAEFDAALCTQPPGVELREAKLDKSLGYKERDQPRPFTHMQPLARAGSR